MLHTAWGKLRVPVTTWLQPGMVSPLSSESLKGASYIQTHTTVNLFFGKKKFLSDKVLQLSLSE